MSVVVGLDLGTTTLTALALNAHSGDLLARVTVPNPAEVASPADRARGRSEWDADALLAAACSALRDACDRMGAGWARLAALGLTGQQHSALLLDPAGRPLGPLVGWQDRRALDPHPGSSHSSLDEALLRAGDDYPARTGCRLAPGFLGLTLFWRLAHGGLPPASRACFLTDYAAARLTGRTAPVTDPTFAASSGLFDVRAGDWDAPMLAALGIPPDVLPDVRPSGTVLGELTPEMAHATGLPAGLPVTLGLGDHQASFLAACVDPDATVVVNVGTGGQVSLRDDRFLTAPGLETRPYPGGGYLLACVGLCGGRSYATLERFFRRAAADLFDCPDAPPLFDRLNALAASVPPGADGLQCLPYFTGTRADPALRATWTGMSAENFTPAHLARALLEGMARAFREGRDALVRLSGREPALLAGSGNGLRENPVLREAVATAFNLPLHVPVYREEAAYGAALLAAAGAGVLPSLADAASLVRYQRA